MDDLVLKVRRLSPLLGGYSPTLYNLLSNKFEEHKSRIQECCAINTFISRAMVAAGAALFIVVLLALHPSVTAYHTGFAGWVVAIVFLTAAVAGSTGRRIHVLIALLFLAFIEPEIKITNSLGFNIVSNGLIIGAGTTWLLGKPRIPGPSLPILAVIGGMFVMTLVFPAIVGALKWIDIHDALIFVKYGIITVLAFSCTGRSVRGIAGVLAISSLLVAALAIFQAFNVSWFGRWLYETYFASRAFSLEEVAHLADNYGRSYGLNGPIGTGLFLVMSLGAWFVLVIRSSTNRRVVLALVGMNVVLVGIFLTGSRLGVVAAAPVLTFGLIWWSASGRLKAQAKYLALTAILVLVVMLGASTLNHSFGLTVESSATRIANTVPNLMRGTPDESFKARLDAYSEIRFSMFGFTPERNNELASEYLIVIARYGLAGFLLLWQLWLMIIVRAVRSAGNATRPGDRSIGMMTMVIVMTLIIGGIGTRALLDPSLTTVLLVLVGLLPVLSRFRNPVPVRVPIETQTASG